MPLNLLKRSEKGSALTHTEGDQNKTDAENFANALETRLDVSINADGTLKDNKVVYAATLAGSDAYAVTVSGTYATLADLAGRILLVKIDVANTGTATLNVNSLGATAIYRPGGVALRSGDLKIGVAALTLYVGGSTYFVLLNPGANSLENYSATSNSSNDYTITIADLDTSSFEVPAAYYAGYTVRAKINAANTGASRLKILATDPSIDLGFADIKKNGSAALEANDFAVDRIYEFVYDGSNFQLVSPIHTQQQVIATEYSSSSIAIPTSAGVLAAALTHSLGGAPSVVTWRLVNVGNASGISHGYAVGDQIGLGSCTDTADYYDSFVPRESSTELQLIFQGVSRIVHKTTGAKVTINATQLSQDFTLSVYAFKT